MKCFNGFLLAIVFVFFISTFGCGGGGGGGSTNSPSITAPSTLGATSPLLEPSNPIIENEVVEQIALDHSFPLNSGYDPPNLNGEYEMSGEVVASDISQAIGTPVNSSIILSNQTSNGRIDFKEVIGSVTSGGAGTYYITGSNDSFTISARTITNTYGCEAENAIIISGYVLPNKDLEVETLSLNVSKTNCDGFTIAEWHEIEGTMIFQAPAAGTVSLSPSDSTFISSRWQTTNFANEQSIYTGNYQSGSICLLHGLLKFDLSSLPSGVFIESAELIMETEYSFGGAGETAIYNIYEDWTESTVTYSNCPDRSYSESTLENVTFTNGQEYSWSITNFVRQWISGAIENNGILIDTSNISDYDSGIFDKSSIRLVINYH